MNFYKLIIPEVETNFDIILQESRYFVKLHEVYYNELYKMSNEAATIYIKRNSYNDATTF